MSNTGDNGIRLRFESPLEFARRYAKNPNLGGLELLSGKARNPGETLLLLLEINGGTAFNVQGTVISNSPGPGGQGYLLRVRFIGLSPKLQAWLDDAAKKLRSQPRQAPPKKAKVNASQHAFVITDFYTGHTQGNLDEAAKFASGQDILGIDLGTSNTCVCIVDGDRPKVIDLRGEFKGAKSLAMPSVVHYGDHGDTHVGYEALPALVDHPRTTVFGAKRFIGRAYDSLPVQRMLPKFPYRVAPGRGGDAAIEVQDKTHSLVTVSGRVLKAARDAAQKALDREIGRAVITVPAYYNDNQRAAVVHAGRLAGLQVERILNEPTAAAIAYGVAQSKKRKILVYDLGGGTFDVSLMQVDGETLGVIASAGDTFLGGDDFDNAVVEWAMQTFAKTYDGHLSRSVDNLGHLKAAANSAKVRLSKVEETTLAVRSVRLTDDSRVRLELPISRKVLEELAYPLVQRTLLCCTDILRDGKVKKEEVDDIILVGGQTRMPLVQRMVQEFFGKELRMEINPDEAVALGAAIFAAMSDSRRKNFVDVLPMSIGIGKDGLFRPILKRNMAVPCVQGITFSVPRSAFEGYSLEIWQGDEQALHRNELLGKLPANAVGPGSQDPVPLRADFAMSADCLLRVTLHNLETGESQHVLLNTRDEGMALAA